MPLTLHYHPLSTYCMKVLAGLYELDLPFAKNVVDLSNPAQRDALRKLWPLVKFPVLEDGSLALPETTVILEHLDARYAPGRLLPASPDQARECRLRDRFFDLYVNTPMGKIVTDRIRPAGQGDPYGVEEARAQLATAYAIAEEWLRDGRPWAVGESFTLADCAAAPALFFAQKVSPIPDAHRRLGAYFSRLLERPSFARVLEEAAPYLAMFPT